MSPLVRAFNQEWSSAETARQAGDFNLSFHHLERAHILGQQSTWRHVKCHLGMWRIGWMRRDRREILGQSTRIIAALLFSRIWVPLGNTGGANVSALQPMEVPADLQALLTPRE